MSKIITFSGSHYGYSDSTMFGLFLIGIDREIPKPRIESVEIPGRNGKLDLTDVLTGDPFYEDFEVTYHFIFESQDEATVITKLGNLCSTLNGELATVKEKRDSTTLYEYINCRLLIQNFRNEGLLWFVDIVAQCLYPASPGGFVGA